MARLLTPLKRVPRTVLLAASALFGSGPCALAQIDAQANSVLPLHEARARAVAGNPGLAMLRERYQALTHIAPQVSSLPDPVVSLNAMNLPWDNFDLNQEPMTQIQIGISQVFPFPGKRSLNEEIAVFEAEAAAYSVEEMRLNLAMNVAQTWWDIFYLDRAVETVHNNQAVFRQLVEVANARYRVGEGLQQDVLQAQLELSKLLDTELQLQGIRQQRAIRLNVLMGAAPDTPVALPADMPPSAGVVAPAAALYRRAEAVRPLLQGEQASIEASASRLALAEKSYYPDFKLGVAYGNREHDPQGQSRQDFVSVMLSVNIPLYAGTRQSQSVQQHRRELSRSRYSLIDQKNLVFSSIASASSDYRQASEQMRLYDTGIVPQSRQAVASMLAGYRVNQVDFLSLARSQSTLFNAELLYWKAFAEAHQSIARLTAAVGEDNIYE